MHLLLFRLAQTVTNSPVCHEDVQTEEGRLCDTGLPAIAADADALRTILQIVFAVIGVIAVLIIVLGALTLVRSNGNPEGLSKARKTIIYAAVGLLVAIAAETIVSFIVGRT
jgi:hypothetical protein